MSRKLFITGSSRGIGAEMARQAVQLDFKVTLHGRTETTALQNLSKELKCNYICFDLSSPTEIALKIANLGEINGLINSAGINISKPFTELRSCDWEKVFAINVFGMANVIRECLPLFGSFQGQKSKIINIASVKGLFSSVGRVAYASSKAAVIQMTAGLAKELSPHIIVNAISPGFIDTDMTKSTLSPRVLNQINQIHLKRLASPAEVAQVAMFLMSNSCEYITGQNIIVDGGFCIKND